MVVKVEYVWIGGKNIHNGCPFTLRSKTRVVESDSVDSADSLPIWNYDGSSTGQAVTNNSEVLIVPRTLFNDPFRGGNNKIVLCDTYLSSRDKEGNLIPHPTNTRYKANEVFSKNLYSEPWYGIEQEFFLMNNDKGRPLGFPLNHALCPLSQGQYYCSAGSKNAIGRKIADEMLDKSLEAGIKVSGMNGEVAPGQWEIQVGPCTGIDAGDQVWMLRYIMERVTEKYNCHISLHPKPIGGDWNGSGCHTNYSTKNMREEGGYEHILEAINKLQSKHKEHLDVYGEGNELRLTGKCETSSIDKFTYGVADRSASIRIPSDAFREKKGYFEDRRPSSLMDPYLVTAKLFETTVVN